MVMRLCGDTYMAVVVKTVLGSHFGWQVNSPPMLQSFKAAAHYFTINVTPVQLKLTEKPPTTF